MRYKKELLPYKILLACFLILFCFNIWARAALRDVETDISEMKQQIQETDERLNIPDEQSEGIYIGTFTATAYCSCEKCCGIYGGKKEAITASGALAKEGITVGADFDTLPKGSTIYIEGIGERIVQDKTAAWITKKYDGRILDIYFSRHESAVQFGRKEVKVFLLKGGG